MRTVLLSLFLVGCGVEADPDEDVAVSELGGCGSGLWCTEASGTTVLLHAVWAANSNDVFAVGDAGTILRRVNGTWTPMTSGSTGNLRGVWGTSSNDVWTVGQGGVALHFDGTAWSPRTVSTSDLDAVWESSATNIWIAGAGAVYHSTGGAFTRTNMTGDLLAVSGTGTNDVWVCGENAYLHHYNGTSWSLVNPGAGTSTYFALIARATNDVWTSDFNPGKETVHYNGSKWTTVRTGAIFEGMFPMAASDIWGAGTSGKIGRWNGSAWTVTTLTGAATLWSITGATGNVWTVGDNGVIGHYIY